MNKKIMIELMSHMCYKIAHRVESSRILWQTEPPGTRTLSEITRHVQCIREIQRALKRDFE